MHSEGNLASCRKLQPAASMMCSLIGIHFGVEAVALPETPRDQIAVTGSRLQPRLVYLRL